MGLAGEREEVVGPRGTNKVRCKRAYRIMGRGMPLSLPPFTVTCPPLPRASRFAIAVSSTLDSITIFNQSSRNRSMLK